MTNEEIEKLIQMNQRLLLVLGYGAGVISSLLSELNSTFHGYKDEKAEWYMDAMTNLVYLDKPLPMMP